MTKPDDVIRFYQRLDLFNGADPAAVIQRYTDDHGKPPKTDKAWDDVYLLEYAEKEVWSGDPEADVCAANQVYTEVLEEWAGISRGAFEPISITEHWASESGPVTLRFQLGGKEASVSPSYNEDWIDLEVLQQINRLIEPSRRQFECAEDGNFAVVMCLTPEQKKAMQTQRHFPFAW